MAYQIVDPSGANLATARQAREAISKLHELRPFYERLTVMDPAGTIMTESDLEVLTEAERRGRIWWAILPDVGRVRIVHWVTLIVIIATVAIIFV